MPVSHAGRRKRGATPGSTFRTGREQNVSQLLFSRFPSHKANSLHGKRRGRRWRGEEEEKEVMVEKE